MQGKSGIQNKLNIRGKKRVIEQSLRVKIKQTGTNFITIRLKRYKITEIATETYCRALKE